MGIEEYRRTNITSSRDYLVSIAESDEPGHSPWNKVGWNPAITTTEEDIWNLGGSYLFPTTASGMEVVSSLATADVDIGTILFNATCDTGGSETTLIDVGVNFTATAAVGDILILDKSGKSPEWGILTAVANGSVTFSGGLSSQGTCSYARAYQVLDVSAAKGAMAIKFDYLDGNYNEKTEICILNINVPVPTINTDIFRINSFRVIAVGTKATTLNAAGGNLSLNLVTAATPTYSYILAGYTRARNNMYTVPLGKTLYVNKWDIGASTPNDTKIQTCRIYTRANREPSTRFLTGNLFYSYTETLISNGQIAIDFKIPTKLMEKTDIKVSAIGLTGFSGPVSSVLRGWLE